MSDEQEAPINWELLGKLVENAETDRINEFVDALSPNEAGRAIARLSGEQQNALLESISPETAAHLIEEISDAQGADLIAHAPAEVAAAIVHELPSNEQADLLGDLPKVDAEAILQNLEPVEAEKLRVLTEYPDDVAGGLMITEYLSYSAEATVQEVINDMRANAEAYRDFHVQYAYVVDESGQLIGVLRLRDLLLASNTTSVSRLMISNPFAVSANDQLESLRETFDRHSFLGVPVIDDDRHLVGVVLKVDVEEALSEKADDDYRKSKGIVSEELRTMPYLLRSRRRLAWLSINILLNIVAASVIAMYQETLSQVIALAVFLPIISDMSGCSGNQAVAVSMRELSLGITQTSDVFRVWMKEIVVGAINGIALGLLIAVVATLWKGNPYLGLVAGSAMAINTMVAVSIGGTIPLILKGLKLDPALASGPILTTVTDMCGFFLALSFATLLLDKLIV